MVMPHHNQTCWLVPLLLSGACLTIAWNILCGLWVENYILTLWTYVLDFQNMLGTSQKSLSCPIRCIRQFNFDSDVAYLATAGGATFLGWINHESKVSLLEMGIVWNKYKAELKLKRDGSPTEMGAHCCWLPQIICSHHCPEVNFTDISQMIRAGSEQWFPCKYRHSFLFTKVQNSDGSHLVRLKEDDLTQHCRLTLNSANSFCTRLLFKSDGKTLVIEIHITPKIYLLLMIKWSTDHFSEGNKLNYW